MVTSTGDDSSAEGATRPSLLIRLRDPKDGEAWRVFVEAYAPLVYAYCRRRGLQASDVSDVTQEVMTQVSRSMAEFSYRPDRGRFRDWLGSVTRTKLLGFLRRDGRAGKGAGGEDAEELMRHLEAPESDTLWTEAFQSRVMEVALERTRPCFEEATWRAFRRTWFDGRSASEAAEELGLPIGSVYVARSRVLRRLREEVSTLAEDGPVPIASGR